MCTLLVFCHLFTKIALALGVYYIAMWCSNINERCALRDEGGMKYVSGVCMGFVLYIHLILPPSLLCCIFSYLIWILLLLFVFINSCLVGTCEGFFFFLLSSESWQQNDECIINWHCYVCVNVEYHREGREIDKVCACVCVCVGVWVCVCVCRTMNREVK